MADDASQPAHGESEPVYEVVEELGRGGMGIVYRARDRRFDRDVAKKVLLGPKDAGLVRRFLREARLTGQLEHPNIPPVHDLGLDEQGNRFFTMKVIEGQGLDRILDALAVGDEETEARYPLPRLLQVFLKACDAVAFAHSHEVIHRDLKPPNIMVGAFGEVQVMDWGLARGPLDDDDLDLGGFLSGEGSGEGSGEDGDGAEFLLSGDSALLGEFPSIDAPPPTKADGHQPTAAPAGPTRYASDLTQAGTIIGTPAYMPPEQAEGRIEEIDERSDVYSLGAVLYEILCLKPPVQGKTAAQILARVHRGEIDPPSETEPGRPVPREVEAVTMKALASDPKERYPDVPSLAQDVQRFLDDRSVTALADSPAIRLWKWVKRNKALTVGMSGASLVAVVLAWFLLLAPGRLTVNCPQGDARVMVDGRDIRDAPFTTLLWPGRHEVVVSAPRFDPSRQTVRIRPGRGSSLDVRLSPRFGTLDVISDPPGAEVRIDGVLAGVTPLSDTALLRGARKVELRKTGHDSVETVIAVEAGTSAKMEKRLPRTTGKVSVSSGVAEVTVRLRAEEDGTRRTWVTNAHDRDLPTGRYEAVFSKVNYFDATRRFEVVQGRPVSLAVELESRISWEASLPGSLRQMAVADLDGDGEMEAVVSMLDEVKGGSLSCRDLPTFSERWTYHQSDFFDDSPAGNFYRFLLWDADRDGILDVLAAGPKSIIVVDGRTGFRKMSHPVRQGVYLTVSDGNGDGAEEVLSGTPYNGLRIVDGRTGARLGAYKRPGLDNVFMPPHTGDFNGDGKPQILLCSRNGSLECLDGRTLRQQWAVGEQFTSIGSMVVGDFHGSGETSVAMITPDGALALIDPAAGKLRGTYRTEPKTGNISDPIDLNGDGAPEFLMLQANGLIRAVRFGGEALETLWRFQEEGVEFRRPMFCDLEGDGDLEIVAAAGSAPLIIVLDHEGAEITRFQTPSPPLSVCLADLNEDGDFEILAAAADGVTSFRFRKPPGLRTFDAAPRLSATPLIQDVDGDGAPDLVFTQIDHIQAWSGKSYRQIWASKHSGGGGILIAPADLDGDRHRDVVAALGYRNGAMAVDGATGNVLWTIKTKGTAYNVPVARDLDGDGRDEVLVFTRRGELICVDGTKGVRRWEKQIGVGYHSPCVTDLDGDGAPEVIVDFAGKPPHLLGYDGCSGKLERKTALKLRATTPTVAADVDGDGKPDLFHGSWRGVVRRFDSDLRLVWEVSTGTPAVNCLPLVADVDGDGAEDLVVSVNTGDLYCLDTRNGREKWHGNVDLMYRGRGFLAGPFCGKPAIFAFNRKGLVVLEGVTGKPMINPATFGPVLSPPAITDFDGDGRADLAVGSASGFVYAVSDYESFLMRVRRPTGPITGGGYKADFLNLSRLARALHQSDVQQMGCLLEKFHPRQPHLLAWRSYYKARLASLEGRSGEAAEAFRKALARRLTSAPVRIGLAGLEIEAGHVEAAKTLILEALADDVVLADRALRDRYLSEGRAILPVLTDILDSDLSRPDPTGDLVARAESAFRRGESRGATTLLGLAVQYGRRDHPDREGLRKRYAAVVEEATLAALEIDGDDKMTAVLKEGLLRDPTNTQMRLMRAFLQIAYGRDDDATFADVEDVVSSDPGNAKALGLRAWLLIRQNKPEEAEALFEKSLRLDPDDPTTNFYWGYHLMQSGRRDEARKAFLKARKNPVLRYSAERFLADLAKGE